MYYNSFLRRTQPISGSWYSWSYSALVLQLFQLCHDSLFGKDSDTVSSALQQFEKGLSMTFSAYNEASKELKTPCHEAGNMESAGTPCFALFTLL